MVGGKKKKKKKKRGGEKKGFVSSEMEESKMQPEAFFL